MANLLQLAKYSIGVGDRFGRQAAAQLRACMLAGEQGIEIVPVWNKSNREHTIIGSDPASVRRAADAAVGRLGWTRPYHVDADHINFDTVERFMEASDFYTLDVADWIGQPAAEPDVLAFVARHPELARSLFSEAGLVAQVAAKYLTAVREAGRIYRKIEERKGKGQFITEVSMDETDQPQTAIELLIILAAIADEGIPIQTIAPKFTGRFNKGVDYAGDVATFAAEFASDLEAIQFAIAEYGLPANLKLSVHSGSDKFSIYGAIHNAIRKADAGVHLKTAGTTWLEELIGLAEAGGEGLELAKEIYDHAYRDREALSKPYAAVINIDPAKLPDLRTVSSWPSDVFVSALRHDPTCPAFNSSFRQLLHVAFKVAAKMGDRYLALLSRCESTIAPNVTRNLLERHIQPVFFGMRASAAER